MINQEQMEGKWDQIKGKIKEKWGQLTDDDIALFEGHRDQFYGRLKEKYGMEREEAEERISDIEKMGDDSACPSCSSPTREGHHS